MSSQDSSSNRFDDGGIGQPVDQVAVRKLGGFNFLSVADWSQLPVDERARRIKADLVIFLFEGEPVGVRDALTYLKHLNQEDPAIEAAEAAKAAESPWFKVEPDPDYDDNNSPGEATWFPVEPDLDYDPGM